MNNDNSIGIISLALAVSLLYPLWTMFSLEMTTINYRLVYIMPVGSSWIISNTVLTGMILILIVIGVNYLFFSEASDK